MNLRYNNEWSNWSSKPNEGLFTRYTYTRAYLIGKRIQLSYSTGYPNKFWMGIFHEKVSIPRNYKFVKINRQFEGCVALNTFSRIFRVILMGHPVVSVCTPLFKSWFSSLLAFQSGTCQNSWFWSHSHSLRLFWRSNATQPYFSIMSNHIGKG